MSRERFVRNLITFSAAGFSVAFFGLALDAFLMQRGVSGVVTLYVSNLLLGAAAGAGVLQHKLLQHQREEVLKQRIECLSELHQHIRNVLTSLSVCSKNNGSAQAEVLSELLRRVENNLANMFSKLIFDPNVPSSVLRIAKRTVDSMAR